MKLIVSELEALRRYVSREFFYVMNDLMLHYNWKQIETMKLWNAPGTLSRRILDEFGELPDTILFWEGYEFVCAHTRDIYSLDCQKLIFADDLHWSNERTRQTKMVGYALCDTILSTYGYVWDEFYPEFCRSKTVKWIPHSASPDFLLRMNECPANSILLSGAINHHYPMRQQMKRLHAEGSYSIAYQGHPGYHCQYDYATNQAIGRGYAETINRHRAGFTDSLKYGYVVAKYFEIPAAGALLFADAAVSGPLKELGFIENRHYFPVSIEDLKEKVEYVLNEANHEELNEIRKKGQELVWERHKTSDRARQIDELCRIR